MNNQILSNLQFSNQRMDFSVELIIKTGILQISDKQIVLLKKTYRKITEQYYENLTQTSANTIIQMNNLLCQTISDKRQSEKLAILSILQILKVKSKCNNQLFQSVQKTIVHLKEPRYMQLSFKTILRCFENAQLFSMGCTFAVLFYCKLQKSSNPQWKQLIGLIGQYPSINTQMCLQLLNIICKDNQGNAKHVVRSGFVKFIISCYLQNKLEDKYLLYKALKFLKLVSYADRTVIRERERPLAQVIFLYDQYTPIVEQLCAKCYDQDYSNQIYQKIKYATDDIDFTYVWSYNQHFCKSFPEKNVKQLIKISEGNRDNISIDTETKVYAILNNLTRFSGMKIDELLLKIPKSSKALFNYLKFLSTALQKDGSIYQKIDFSMLQKLVLDDQNPKSKPLLKYVQSFSTKQKKITQLNQQLLEMFSIQKNADMMIQNASKVPSNNQQLKLIKQLLRQKQGVNQFQNDMITSVKQKAIQSLTTAIVNKNAIDLNSLIKEIQLKNVNILAKLLKTVEVGIMMQHFSQNDFDKNKIFQIILWIQNNYQGELIDWGSISQIILIFQGQQAWLNHLNQLPNKCFYLLGATQFNHKQFQLLSQALTSTLSKIDKKSHKIPLIIGFLGKNLSNIQKAKLISKHSEWFKLIQTNIKSENHWKTNLYMSSLFIFKWFQQKNAEQNKQFQKIIQPVNSYVLSTLKSTQHQYRYLQACLPYKFVVSQIVDNIDFLLSQNGNLAAYIYKNSNPLPNINYDKISNLNNIPIAQNKNILQILNFLKQFPNITQGDQINKLYKRIIENDKKYWQMYPNFVIIIKAILQILGKTQNPIIIKDLTQMLIDLLNNLQTNTEITPEQKDQILQQLITTFKTLGQRGVYVDLERLKRVIIKIQNQQIKNDLLNILQNYVIKQKLSQPQKSTKPSKNSIDPPKMIQKVEHKIQESKKQQKVQNKIAKKQQDKIQVKVALQKPVKKGQTQVTNEERNYMTTLQSAKSTNQTQVIMKQKQHLWMDPKQKTKMQTQLKLLQSTQNDKQIQKEQLSIVQVLRKIKNINEKKCDPKQFPPCVDIIKKCQVKSTLRDVLGHLLAEFYNRIEKHPQVLILLLDKTKTNLSKEACFSIVSKNAEAFILGNRWKFQGRQWLDIAINRMSQGFFASACQVAQYNLIKVEDLHYFYEKKYQNNVVKDIYKVQTQEDAIFYLLLIGTTARLSDVKKYYIKDLLHISILNYIDRWTSGYKITANLFYALSSLVYIQPEICLQIAKKQTQLAKLLNNLAINYDSRAVVESGGCFIANMAYANDQVKQLLRKNGVIQKLILVFNQNLEDPELSTFKQLLRSFGNLSLAQKCAKQIIDQNFCISMVKMIQNFNMFVNLDQNKLKILKIAIDVLANLCSHKYNLLTLHRQGVTNTIIMLLETTQINPPIIMGCIDTIDGLCQNPQVEQFSVNSKKLPFILIDILKIQEDQKIIVKAVRLLTNLTINQRNIAYILQANLLSVLGNIVLPSFFMKYNKKTQLNYLSNNPSASSAPNNKMELYINKVLVRIHNSKPNFQLLLKSGYLDCLVRTIQTADNLDDIYIDILASYAKVLPNFLNKRAFMCLIRVLTRKIKSKDIIEKCLRIFKTLLLRSYDRDEEDVVLQQSPKMYQKMLQDYKHDALFLLGLHCAMSKKLRRLLISKQKDYKLISQIYQLSQIQEYQQLANSVLFTLFNKSQKPKQQVNQQTEQSAVKRLKAGFMCDLYRIDGSFKKAKIKLNEQNNLVAFKYPDGQIKNKYSLSLKNLRDWQFDYQKASRQWKLSVFSKSKGLFAAETDAQLCGTLIGGLQWGEVAYINVVFNSKQDKQIFKKSLDTVIFTSM